MLTEHSGGLLFLSLEARRSLGHSVLKLQLAHGASSQRDAGHTLAGI